ncbi:response regulator [Candidatus Mcinerneyibacteriota bacterium]|nr:response regulator [Candidatus Mcinerneyibacteriota bacterium]
MNIYILDDQEENRALISHIIKHHTSHEVYEFSTGEALLKYLEREAGQPDLFLLDILMAEMDGFEVARRIKKDERFSDIPVIFLTALSDKDSVAKGFESGGSDYISKPFSKEELLARITVHLNLRQSLRELKNHSLELEKDNELFLIRGKELRSLYHILQQGMEESSLDDFFREVVSNIIPGAFSSSRNPMVFIKYRGEVFHNTSEGEKPPQYSVKAPLMIQGREEGALVVGFQSGKRENSVEYERKLIFLFAEKITRVIEHFEKESLLRYDVFLLRKALDFMEKRGYILFSVSHHVIAHNETFLEAFGISRDLTKEKGRVYTREELSGLLKPEVKKVLKMFLEEDSRNKIPVTAQNGNEYTLLSLPLEDEGIVTGKLWILENEKESDG